MSDKDVVVESREGGGASTWRWTGRRGGYLIEKDAEGDVRCSVSITRTDGLPSKALLDLNDYRSIEILRLASSLRILTQALHEAAFNGADLDGVGCEEILESAGLVEWTAYDPEAHADIAFAAQPEPHDQIWILTDFGKQVLGVAP